MPPQFLLRAEDRLEGGPGSGEGERFCITGPEAFHIVKVLRLGEGQALSLFDGHGGRYAADITRILPNGGVEGVVTKVLAASRPKAAASLRLYQGLLKASSWEWLLEKGTELGVASFTPVLTPRTVVLLREADRAKAKLERWSRIILSAAKQCGRGGLPELRPALRFPEALQDAKARGLVLLGWERMAGASAAESLREELAAAVGAAKAEGAQVSLFIGPEGGFSEEEVELAESLDAVLFGLGPNTLRAETAAVAASSVVLYELGEL